MRDLITKPFPVVREQCVSKLREQQHALLTFLLTPISTTPTSEPGKRNTHAGLRPLESAHDFCSRTGHEAPLKGGLWHIPSLLPRDDVLRAAVARG